MNKIYGLIESNPDDRNWIFGGSTKLPTVVLQLDRDWTKYLPANK